MDIEILDADGICDGELELFADAPEPVSSSEPFDIDPAAGPEPPPGGGRIPLDPEPSTALLLASGLAALAVGRRCPER